MIKKLKVLGYDKLSRMAFTLAEVLIVLGVIGIVAELTIPVIVMDVQKQEYVALLKKTYSEMSQMFKMYLADEGVSQLSDTNISNGSSTPYSDLASEQALDAIVKKYMKVTKSCVSGDSSCIHSSKVSCLNASGTDCAISSWFSNTSHYYAYMPDGVEVELELNSAATCATGTNCGLVVIDVNGDKGPNKAGRDVFIQYRILNNGTLIPYMGQQWAAAVGNSSAYWQASSTSCGTAGSSTLSGIVQGNGCVARIMENGWVMDY